MVQYLYIFQLQDFVQKPLRCSEVLKVVFPSKTGSSYVSLYPWGLGLEHIRMLMCPASCLHVVSGLTETWNEVMTAVTTNSTIFWDVTSCSLVDIHRCFEGISCLYLQDWKANQASAFIFASSTTVLVLYIFFHIVLSSKLLLTMA
jgi:hypothetical protein